jgi:hypothetical protein
MAVLVEQNDKNPYLSLSDSFRELYFSLNNPEMSVTVVNVFTFHISPRQ